MTVEEIRRYLELANRKSLILLRSGTGWKPEYAAELEYIDRELAKYRQTIDDMHERRRAVLFGRNNL